MPAVTEQAGAQGKHGLSPGTAPAHARSFHALLDNSFGR